MGHKTAHGAGFLLYIKLVCPFVWLDSMPLGLIEIESKLVWIFRGFGMRSFIRHIFHVRKKENQVSIQKKKKKKKKRA